MGAYNVLNRARLASGQPEDVSDVLANLDLIATILNGGLDNSNVNAAAAIAFSKLVGPSGIAAGEIPVWNGSAWVRSSTLNTVTLNPNAGLGATYAITAINTDLAVPTNGVHGINPTGAGFSIRSMAAGAVGQRVVLRGQSGNFVTILHATAGGTGAQFYLRGQANVVLGLLDTIEFQYDGTNWNEVGRDKIMPSSKLRASATQSIPSGVVTTVTVLDTADWSQGGATRSGSTILLPENGIYAARAHVNFAANVTGYRELYINKGVAGGVTVGYQPMLASAFNAGSVELHCSCQFNGAAGEAVSLLVFQNSGVALTIDIGSGSFYRGLEVTRIA